MNIGLKKYVNVVQWYVMTIEKVVQLQIDSFVTIVCQ